MRSSGPLLRVALLCHHEVIIISMIVFVIISVCGKEHLDIRPGKSRDSRHDSGDDDHDS